MQKKPVWQGTTDQIKNLIWKRMPAGRKPQVSKPKKGKSSVEHRRPLGEVNNEQPGLGAGAMVSVEPTTMDPKDPVLGKKKTLKGMNKTPKDIVESGPFADPKVRAKWQYVKGDASAERARMKKMTKPPFDKPKPSVKLTKGPLGKVRHASKAEAELLKKQGWSVVKEEAEPQHIYHVTHTKHVGKIQKQGIMPMKTSNWVQAGNKERYGGGEVYAFTHKDDAHAWAGRMDWAHNQKLGSGNISIITAHRPSDRKFEVDNNDPISQAGKKGDWLKTHGSIAPHHIVSVEKYMPKKLGEDKIGKQSPSVEEIAKKHGMSVEKVNAQLDKGVPVEREHTNSDDEAREIARDHVHEFPDYYDRLDKMENKAKKGIKEHIVKVGDKYRLVSKKSGKNLGTYNSKAGAAKRERQVQYFKHVGEDALTFAQMAQQAGAGLAIGAAYGGVGIASIAKLKKKLKERQAKKKLKEETFSKVKSRRWRGRLGKINQKRLQHTDSDRSMIDNRFVGGVDTGQFSKKKKTVKEARVMKMKDYIKQMYPKQELPPKKPHPVPAGFERVKDGKFNVLRKIKEEYNPDVELIRNRIQSHIGVAKKMAAEHGEKSQEAGFHRALVKRYQRELKDIHGLDEMTANAVGGGMSPVIGGEGNIHGIDPIMGQKPVRRRKFAGKQVFVVDPTTYHNAYLGKRRYEHFEKYLEGSPMLDDIREYARKYWAEPIIIENEQTGAMVYLKYGSK